jgi:hypothetical protein
MKSAPPGHSPSPAAREPAAGRLASLRTVFREVPSTLGLVWAADRAAALQIVALTAASALLPAAIAWVG